MQLPRLLALTAVLFASVGSLAVAEKNPPTSRTAASNLPNTDQYLIPAKPGSAIFNPDIFFDYEVWAAPQETHWYVVAEYKDGSVSEYRCVTEDSAKQFQLWLYFHIAELKKATVVSRVEAGDYVFFQSFDKRADAQNLAALLQSVGLYVEIRSVSTLQFNQPYQP
jgi:hypothetical protein